MQALMRMRFGPYTFLQNPAQLQVENRALQHAARQPVAAFKSVVSVAYLLSFTVQIY